MNGTFLIGVSVVANCFAPLLYAQPAIEWQRALGGALEDRAESVARTGDGGYIVAGGANSSDGDVAVNQGGLDLWVVKLGDDGGLQWETSYGGTGTDGANAICQTGDGGYIVTGSTASNDGDVVGHHGLADWWVLKLSGNGDIEWQRTLGGTDGEAASSVRQTSDGGYVLVGGTSSNDGDVSGNHGSADFWIVKLDAEGGLQWQRCYGGSAWEVAQSIQQTGDGGFIMVGNTSSNNGDVTGNHGGYDVWIVKLNSFGNIEWQRTVGGSEQDNASEVVLCADGGSVVAASTMSSDGDVQGAHGLLDAWVIKLSSSGVIEWSEVLGGTSNDAAISIVEDGNGDLVIVGWSESDDGDVNGGHGTEDAWVVKLDSSGTVLWQRCLGGSSSESAKSVDLELNGGLVIAGSAKSDDGDVTGHHGNGDMWVVKLGQDEVGVIDLNNSMGLVHPNPCDGLITMSFTRQQRPVFIQLVSIAGCVVQEWAAPGDSGIFTIELSNFESGLYHLRAVLQDGTVLVERVVRS